jgi:hypothetical protein
VDDDDLDEVSLREFHQLIDEALARPSMLRLGWRLLCWRLRVLVRGWRGAGRR